jgi:hypothetical protein
MYSSPSSHRVTSRLHTPAKQSVDKAARLEALAQLVEDGIPNLKSKDERRFYREVARSYRVAAQREVQARRSS